MAISASHYARCMKIACKLLVSVDQQTLLQRKSFWRKGRGQKGGEGRGGLNPKSLYHPVASDLAILHESANAHSDSRPGIKIVSQLMF